MKNKNKIMSCTPEKLFKMNKTVLSLYNNITNVNKNISNYDCIANIEGFHAEAFNEKCFCAITNRRLNSIGKKKKKKPLM